MPEPTARDPAPLLGLPVAEAPLAAAEPPDESPETAALAPTEVAAEAPLVALAPAEVVAVCVGRQNQRGQLESERARLLTPRISVDW